MCIIKIGMYKLHEKCYKSVISRDDSVCSSYTGLYLQVSIQLLSYVHENCEAQCLSQVRQLVLMIFLLSSNVSMAINGLI